MNRILIIVFLFLSFLSCKTKELAIAPSTNKPEEFTPTEIPDFIIAFGSGYNQEKENPFWFDILNNKADLWIWGGDNIYCDTEDMSVLKKCYDKQASKGDYRYFRKNIDVIGMWDDHDYGLNDGGQEYLYKKESQQLFLDFLKVPKDDPRRQQEGTYSSYTYQIKGKIIKVILLDTRYFRTALTEDTETKKRYKPNVYGEGTMLGDAQWNWLKEELTNSKADYNVINSSIQFLSNQHGFEAWGNMPHEVEKLEQLILESKAKNVFVLSGDRHISEVSMKPIGKNNYPLYDFTSSGLTHAYTGFTKEENPYRVSKVIHQKSYGLVKFYFEKNMLEFEMRGVNKTSLETVFVKF